MKPMTRFTSLIAALAFAIVLIASPRANAQTPAELAPADTAIFVHMSNPAAWFSDLTQGPIGTKMREKIETAEGSGDLLAALGMKLDQFMAAYFGGDVVVLSPGKGKDGVIFTQVTKANREHAIDSLGLQRNGDVAGYPLYVGSDGNGYFAMMDNWVAMCDLNTFEYLKSILSQPAGGKRLIDTDHYKRWTKELPDRRTMTMLSFESVESQHAIGVVRNGISLDATYLGISPGANELMSILGENDTADFGPLPASTLGALTFNILANEEMKAQYKGLDMLLAGKSFVNDVLPKLDAPTVLFMGSVPGKSVDPAVGVEVPVNGLALKMKDASVAQDLNLLFDNAVLLANVAVTQIPAGQIPQRTGTYKDASYKVAEIGTPIAKALQFSEIAPIQLVYGRVGDYFVFCTQENFFKQCVDANAGGQAMRMSVEGKAHRLAVTPVLAMTGKPDGFATMLLSWGKMLEAKGLPESMVGEDNKPLELDKLFDFVKMIQQYSLMKMQIWSGEDGVVIGRMQLTAPL